MKKILILGTNFGSCEMVRTAKKMGIYTIVTDNFPPEHSFAKIISDEYWMIDTSMVDELEKECLRNGIDGVVCGATSDFNIGKAMELSQRLGLPFYCTPDAWKYSKDKGLFKELCKQYDISVPKEYILSNPPTQKELEKIEYPVVVKAINLSGNKGMSYCYNENEVLEGARYARELSGEDSIVCEKMIIGEEISACYIMANGDIRLVNVNSLNHEPGEPSNCYSITTTETKYLPKYIEALNDKVINLFKAIGCKEGYAWVELMVDEREKFYMLEMGHRLPGDEINIPPTMMTGFSPHKQIIDFSLGRRTPISALPDSIVGFYDRCGTVYNIWTKKAGKIGKIIGLEEIQKIGDIYVDFVIWEGKEVLQYALIGEFAFVTANMEETCEIISRINRILKIEDESGNNMIIYYTDYKHLCNNDRFHVEGTEWENLF